jgi:hypothetical protein
MTETLSTAASSDAPVVSIPQERRIVTAIPGPRSQALHERRLAVVPSGVSSVLPVYIAKANGAILVDVDGNQFVDFGAGIGVTTIGHTEKAVVEAAASQLQDVIHTLFTVTPYEEYVRVAELLAEHTPGDHAKKTVLVNSGAEAVENGVKIARKHTGRRGVAVLDHAYHGRTNLTMAMNFKAMPYGTGFGPFAGDVYHAPSSYPYHDGLSGAEAAARTIAYLEKIVGASDLACLVVEPIQGEGGFMVPADGYLPALQEWCTANGVVFIADEIQSGMARTGAYYASEHFGLVPDLVLSAKVSPAVSPSPRSPAVQRSWTRPTPVASEERSEATPSPPLPPSPCSKRSSAATCSPRGVESKPRSNRPFWPCSRSTTSSATCAESARCSRSSSSSRAQDPRRRSPTPQRSARSRRTRRSTACSSSPRAPTETCCASCRASPSRTS